MCATQGALYRELIAAQYVIIGERHPHTIASIGNLVETLMMTEQYREARVALDTAPMVAREVLGDAHPITLITRAREAQLLCVEVGTYVEGEQLLAHIVSRMASLHGKEHHMTRKYAAALRKVRASEQAEEVRWLLAHQSAMAAEQESSGKSRSLSTSQRRPPSGNNRAASFLLRRVSFGRKLRSSSSLPFVDQASSSLPDAYALPEESSGLGEWRVVDDDDEVRPSAPATPSETQRSMSTQTPELPGIPPLSKLEPMHLTT